MITVTQHKPFESSKKIIFKDSALAHKYCDQGEGLEIGAAAHNPFHLPNCRNVSNEESYDFFKDSQISMCGAFAHADIIADAADIPLDNESQDYVISSHMIEHHPDPLACFIEWSRLIKNQGIIFCIFPKRDALPEDRERPITELSTLIKAHRERLTLDTVSSKNIPGGRGGHYYVYTLQLMLDLIAYFNRYLAKGYKLEVIEAEETDDKVGNAHTIVLRKIIKK